MELECHTEFYFLSSAWGASLFSLSPIGGGGLPFGCPGSFFPEWLSCTPLVELVGYSGDQVSQSAVASQSYQLCFTPSILIIRSLGYY